MANHTTGAQRYNARMERIFVDFRRNTRVSAQSCPRHWDHYKAGGYDVGVRPLTCHCPSDACTLCVTCAERPLLANT
jgi:hypothetical protein